ERRHQRRKDLALTHLVRAAACTLRGGTDHKAIGSPRTPPNSLSPACTVPLRGRGYWHREWTADSLRSAPGQRCVVQPTRTRIGPRQKGRRAISALADVLEPICGLAVVDATPRNFLRIALEPEALRVFGNYPVSGTRQSLGVRRACLFMPQRPQTRRCW